MKNGRSIMLTGVLSLVMAACSSPGVEISDFGSLSTGEPVRLFRISNGTGAYLDVTDYGARVVSIVMPDRDGVFADVVVGVGDIDGFENGKERFLGCVIGRYGNRIDHSSFVLEGHEYELVPNEKHDGEPVQCHGGPEGFDRFVWDAETVSCEGRWGVRFSRLSPDGEQGYPGNLACSVTYWLSKDNVVAIEYGAGTDAPTHVNLSNHTYFNPGGPSGGYVMDALLTVYADTSVVNNSHYCPDRLVCVDGTPFDFREPHRVDYRVDMRDPQLDMMRGMSACWKLDGWDGTLRKAAVLYDRDSGRGIETWTTEPALLTYTGRSFNGSIEGKHGPIEKFSGMLLETIHFPDSPNQDRFPTTVLRPGERYHSITEYRFFAE